MPPPISPSSGEKTPLVPANGANAQVPDEAHQSHLLKSVAIGSFSNFSTVTRPGLDLIIAFQGRLALGSRDYLELGGGQGFTVFQDDIYTGTPSVREGVAYAAFGLHALIDYKHLFSGKTGIGAMWDTAGLLVYGYRVADKINTVTFGTNTSAGPKFILRLSPTSNVTLAAGLRLDFLPENPALGPFLRVGFEG